MIKFLITGGNGFIGTNFLETLREEIKEPYLIDIIDIHPPKIDLQDHETWTDLDILNNDALNILFEKKKPQITIHLAAQTDCSPNLKLSDYLVNTKGSENIFEACQKNAVEFLIHTSTQFVHQNSYPPASDTDYSPHTVYGESKIISEKILREKRFSFNYTIVRPTNVWGPHHLRYPYEFWKVVRDGKYFHPGKRKSLRSYGYVGNVCHQMIELIKRREEALISRQVFYVGDRPIDLFEWVNAFSLSIKKRSATIVPSSLIYILAMFGSILQKFGIKFPITTSRYKSMTSDNPAPMEKTFAILGTGHYTLEEGVKKTTDWLFEFWKKENI